MNVKTAFGLLVAGVCVSAFSFGVSYFFASHPIFQSLNKKFSITEEQPAVHPPDAVAKVGEEYLYKQDVNSLMVDTPKASPGVTVEVQSVQKADSLQTLVNQSIILQAAQADGLVILDNTVFNSKTKDLHKRTQLVSEVIKKINDQADGVRGWIVKLSFEYPNEFTYEETRSRAYAKIKELYDQVENGNLSFNEINERIKIDASLGKNSPYYKVHNPYEFWSKHPDSITFIPAFDELLYGLDENEISDIFHTKDSDYTSGRGFENASDSAQKSSRDEFYLFGKITKITNSNNPNAGNWINEKTNHYEIQYY